MTDAKDYEFLDGNGRRRVVRGWCEANWEDSAYDDVKRRWREGWDAASHLGLAMEATGTRYSIVRLERRGWVLALQNDRIAVNREGESTVTPVSEGGQIVRFDDEAALLYEIRSRVHLDDLADPYVNLLADWGRSDLVEDWQRDDGIAPPGSED